MAKKLFTQVSMFNLNQPIFLADTDGDIKNIANPTIDELPATLYDLIDKYGVNEIELNGSEKYITAVGKEMLNDLTTKYSRNVRIKINGEVFN